MINNEYQRIFNELSAICDFVLIGSMAIKYVYPNIISYEPKDADIVVSENADLKKIIQFFIDNKYIVQSWEEEIDNKFDYNKLNGRIYFRAIKDKYIFDVNYSMLNIDYSELLNGIQVIGNIKVPTKDMFIRLLESANNEKSKAMLKNII